MGNNKSKRKRSSRVVSMAFCDTSKITKRCDAPTCFLPNKPVLPPIVYHVNGSQWLISANSFLSVPVHKGRHDWFASLFKGKRNTWTGWQQSYAKSPTT